MIGAKVARLLSQQLHRRVVAHSVTMVIEVDVKLQNASGIASRPLLYMFRYSRRGIVAKKSGTVPLKLFSPIFNNSRFVKLPKAGGIDPVKLFLASLRMPN